MTAKVSAQAPSFSTPLRIGVLLLPTGAQLLDISPIDLFSMLSKSYLTACQLPRPILALGLPEVQIDYICPLPTGSNIPCTANANLISTADLASPSVISGSLDILLIPGPDPSATPSEEVCRFVRAHTDCPTTSVLIVCTGIFIGGHAGILKDKRVTGPRGLLPLLRKNFPDAKWVDSRWSRDGEIWCSGGITNGLDMAAAFIREKWPGPLSDTICALADVGDQSNEYEHGIVIETSWWLWLILRSWYRNWGK